MKKKKGLKIFLIILLIALVPTGYFVFKLTKPVQYQITYSCLEDGTNNAKNPKKFTAKDGEITLLEPTRVGYEFDGWFVDPEFQTSITSINASECKGITIYAKWIANKYRISYDAQGGICSATPEVITFDQPYGTLPNATREGYVFDGWHTSATEESKVESTSLVKIGQDHTLYAHWAGNTYYIKYDANGGSGSMIKSKFSYGTEKALSTNTFTREGYVFKGWNTKANGSGTAYAENAIVKNWTMVAGIEFTLYAQWKVKTMMITFDGNGGTPSQPTKEVLYNSAYASFPTATKAGYVFMGWTKDQTTGLRVSERDVVTEDHTLYAIWSPASIKVTLNHQTGTQGSQYIYYKYTQDGYYSDGNFIPSKKITSVSIPKKTGYDFAGYYSEPFGAGTQCVNSKGLIDAELCDLFSSNSQIYAKWTYKINYLGNGANSGNMSTQTLVYGVSQKLFGNQYKKSGCYFAGWKLAQSAYTRDFADFETVSDEDFPNSRSSSTITLYAHWNSGSISLTLDSYYANGNSYTVYYLYDGDRLCVDKECTDDSVRLFDPEREGFTFKGWETSNGILLIDEYSDPKSELFKTSGNSGNLTLYARWQAKAYSVTLDANGGTFLCDEDYATSVTVSSGKTTIVKNVMNKDEKYKLVIGKASLISGTATSFDVIISATSEVLFAKSFNFGTNISLEYSAPVGLDEEVTISIICLDASVFENIEFKVTKSVKYGEKYSSTSGFFLPKREGYVFAGFYDAAIGGNAIESDSVVDKTSSHTLYAHWTAK